MVGVVWNILSEVREIEQSGRESALVEAFGDELLLFDSKTDIAMSGGEHHAVGASRGVGLRGVTARHNDIHAVEIGASPFDGAGHDGSAVGTSEGDTSAGIGCRA